MTDKHITPEFGAVNLTPTAAEREQRNPLENVLRHVDTTRRTTDKSVGGFSWVPQYALSDLGIYVLMIIAFFAFTVIAHYVF